ncbi:hypothetical protein N9P56_01155 [Flavobacteriaceae bacterium]|nr:hypothetical protein [Flavobacteriaceae bacterium]
MRTLYLKIALFLAPLFLVWLALEVFYRQVPNNYSYKDQQLQKVAPDVQTLVMGDSHAFYGINPVYFKDPTFNLSNISQSLLTDELLLEKHIANLPALKTVFINISYFTLSTKDNALESNWRKYFYHHNMGITAPSISFWNPQRYSMALIQRFDKSMDLVQKYHNNYTIVNATPLGYGMQDASDIVKDKEAISIVIANKHEDNSLDFKHNTARLQRIIALCKKYEVAVVLLEMPVYPAYYNLLDTEKKEKIKSNLNNLSGVDDTVFYLDLSTNPLFEKQDLRDADHLTNSGAKKCSEYLNTYLKDIVHYKLDK